MLTQYYKGKHFFQKYLASLGTDMPLAPPDERAEGKRFYRSSQAYLVNVYEFKDYIIGRKVTASSDDLPFRQTWIEFNGYGLKASNDVWIYGCGLDLDSKILHLCVSPNPDGALDFIQVKENHIEYDKSVEVFAQLVSFLKPEFVNTTTKSVRIGHTLKKGKRIDHISDYIVVYRKKPKSITKNLGTCPVDWQHRWHQSGHWRKIKGTGKDAEGNEVEERTWVKSCVKGPEDKPLVNKIRLVKDSLPPSFQQFRGITA